MNTHNKPPRISRAKKAVIAVAASTALGACTMEDGGDKVYANLDAKEQANLKKAATRHAVELMASFSKKDVYASNDSLRAEDALTMDATGEETGNPLTFRESDMVSFTVETATQGTRLIMERSNIEYCVDNATGDIAPEEDCPYDTDDYVDTGYHAVFTNPNSDLLQANTELSFKDVRRFMAADTTYLAEIGDAYGTEVFFIDIEGAVTRDGYDYNAPDSAADTRRALDDIANDY